MHGLRSATLALGLALVAAACSTSGRDDTSSLPSTSSTTPTTTEAAVQAPGNLPTGPSALADRFHPDLPEPLVDPSEIRSGGPPPDGIPPIDDPTFVPVAEADAWLADPEPVILLELEGEARAYPIQILIWHEIVNDTVAGVPVAVTYCPLCNSGITFDRRVRGVETTFGTSGMLYNANLVMYDRATESLWNQLDGRAVVGVLTGERLDRLPSVVVSWEELRRTRPTAAVLSRDTGFRRDYGRNPYTGLDDPDGTPFLFSGRLDGRAKAMQRVVAVDDGDRAVAWTLEAISGSGPTVTVGEIGDEPIVVFWQPGQASALETDDVSGGRDVGDVGVFTTTVDGRVLDFEVRDGAFVDTETGSTWNVLGEAVGGPLAGTRLEPVTFVRTFWFSWAAFRPDTLLVDAPTS
ncbi:MAG TPA: DUF3179 domain-containing protein [Actinobacteria bacterium]|nr:DUF3179 domain-containing protein [Actinomycetota bacterium]